MTPTAQLTTASDNVTDDVTDPEAPALQVLKHVALICHTIPSCSFHMCDMSHHVCDMSLHMCDMSLHMCDMSRMMSRTLKPSHYRYLRT